MKRERNYHRTVLITIVFALLIIVSVKGLAIDLSLVFSVEGFKQIVSYFADLYPPDFSQKYLYEVYHASIETLAVSITGTIFAILIAFILSPFATRTLTPMRWVSGGKKPQRAPFKVFLIAISRMTLNILRSIPELLWAMIFILMVGLGPFAGVLAIGLHTGGVLGKLYSDVLENVDPGPLEAIHATGAGRLKVFLYGVIPQAFPQCISYTLYRWEMNIRAATILGFVGAGGIGLLFHKAISLFHGDRISTLIIVTFIMVNIVDSLSLYVRKKVV
jgi:phosphonate transport system permease protein